MNDDKFFLKWNRIHNKALPNYVITMLISAITGIFLAYTFLCFINAEVFEWGSKHFLPAYAIAMVITTSIVSIYKWFELEQRYKDILSLREEVKHETNE